MITYKYVVSDKQGLHATNAMSLSRAASEYESRITLKSQRVQRTVRMSLLS